MSRTTKYEFSSSSRNARSSLNPRPIACTRSRTFTARNLSGAPDSSTVTSPVSESTRILTPVSASRRRFVSPPGPIRTPIRSLGIRTYSTSATPEPGPEPLRVRVHAEAGEVPRDVRDVPDEPLVAPRVVERHRLRAVDDPRTAVPPQEVVLAQVPVHEFRLPHRRHRAEDVLVRRGGVLERHFPDHRRGHRLVPDILHEEDVLVDRVPLRDAHAGRAHPDEVLVLLLRPHLDHLAERAAHGLEPRVPAEVVREGAERRVAHAVDLEGGASLLGRRVEHVPLLPRAHRVVHGLDRAVGDHLVQGQERGLVEHLVDRLPRLVLLAPAPEDLDPFLEEGELAFVQHGSRRYWDRGKKVPARRKGR